MSGLLRRRRQVGHVDPDVLSRVDPYFVHARHPNGRLVAAEIPELELGCAIWDVETGDLVWDPQATSAAWSHGGDQLARLTGNDGETFELASWPERQSLASCRVHPRACCNERVALSPRGDLAAVLWWHQTEGGMEFVALDGRTASHLSGRGYTTDETNLLEGPTFSDDGAIVAVSEGNPFWWGAYNYDEPSQGGRFVRGWLTLIAVDSGRVERIEAYETVSPGWRPEEGREERVELLGRPEFASPTEVVLRPEYGSEYRIQVPARR